MDLSSPTTLRPVQDEDRELLYRIYASTREEELQQVPWSPAQKDAFLRMQFEAQDRYYREHFADATFDLIVQGDEVLGRLYVDRRQDEIRLIDIALLPTARGLGIGSRLLRELLAEGEAADKPVRIHVEQLNPALRLYRRLGFRKIEEQGVYHLMEWRPVR